MNDPLFYINTYFGALRDVQEQKQDFSSGEQADMAYARTCEVIGVFGTIQDLRQITQIHADHKLIQSEKERINYEQSRTAI